jgi:hypothetical protein
MVKDKTTLVIERDILRRIRIIAYLNDMELSELVEQALDEKLNRMKKVEEYEEYQDVKDLKVSSKKSKQSQQQQYSQGFKAPVREEKGEGELHLVLPGLSFPTNKDKLMQIAKKHDSHLEEYQEDAESVTPYIEKLPDKKTYRDESQLEEDIKRVSNTDKKLIELGELFDVNKTVGVIISKSATDRTAYRLKNQSQKDRIKGESVKMI